MKPENKERLFVGFILIITTILGLLFVLWVNERFIANDSEKDDSNVSTSTHEITNPKEEQINVNTDEIMPKDDSVKEKELTDLEKYNLYKKFSVYPNGIDTPEDYIDNATQELVNAGRKITVQGKIDDAYVYIKAGANDEKGNFTSVKEQYDGIWFYITDGTFNGGQLNLAKSKYGEPSELTELLYNLKRVPAAKNLDDYRAGDYQILNMLEELKDERFIGSLVSTDRYGKILELTIGYKCAEGEQCSIK